MFERSADWASVSVMPIGGAATCLAAVRGHADLLTRATPHAARATVWTLNLGGLVDRAVPRGAPIPGSLFLNFHAVADKK